jgi:hypothetical protein
MGDLFDNWGKSPEGVGQMKRHRPFDEESSGTLKKLNEISVSLRRSNGYVVTGKPSARSGKGAK